MNVSKFFAFLGAVFLAALLLYLFSTPHGNEIALTGIVDANEVIVSAKISGRLDQLLVDEGRDVKSGELIAVLDSAELRAQRDSAAAAIRSFEAQVQQAQSSTGLTDLQTSAQVDQSGATLTALKSQLEASRSDLARVEADQKRMQSLFEGGIATAQDKDHADAALHSAQAQTRALEEQVKAQEASLEIARAGRKQVNVQENVLAAMQAQLAQARAAKAEAETRLGYARIFSPLDGVVAVRVARQGEVVQPGSPIVTIVDIDHLWVRTSIEESQVDSIQMGQKLRVKMPSGKILDGTVIFKGVESEFATQRDVSRTKRDIKTFAIKVAIPNPGRRFFSGMTAYVLLPPPAKNKNSSADSAADSPGK
ncbi:MAG: HlyD family secretion protein [Acidobacteriia bacterium]|nr:HlyD family secretion protein [Terriglobia bacterium]